jgi:predicted N-acetyltransferase YhbS
LTVSIRPYNPQQDLAALFELWPAALAPLWPITRPELLRAILTDHSNYRTGDHWVAEASGRIVGLVATQIDRRNSTPNPYGGIAVLLVDPQRQRQGIGSALHEAALSYLKQMGIRQATLGGGGVARFWPGVPGNLPDARAFFENQGWTFSETTYDLVRQLRDYQTPPAISQRMREEQIEIRAATANEVEEVLDFEQREFPNWMREFQPKALAGDYADFLIARDRRGIVGTLLLFTPQSHRLSANLIWKALLGDDLGGLGAVGVAASERGRGIGLALVARASELLQARGVGHSHIDWTGLISFYGRLGYTPWREYYLGEREL